MADFWEQQELQQEVAGQGIPQNTPMLVAVRARPLSRDEAERGEFGIVRVLESRVVVVLDPQDYDRNLQPNRSKEKKYAFDYVFDEDASQAEIFSGTTRGLINGVLVGFNASVFAYGATGAGKTYTMLGALDSPGVMVLTLNDLYRRMRSDPQYADSDFKVRLSYLEIYNEVIKDLLNPTDSSIGLPLNEDPVRGMVVAGITEYDATSASEILQLLHHGNMARAQEPTAANRTSSRSHAILQVSVERSERTAHVVGQVTCGKLSLIDLAGSERASKTENTGLRLKEGANINRSLLALGNCINALADGRSHVPYRDSKMTRLLKDSLGGNCRTVMIANISPASTQFEETLNSLKYANRAKNLKTKVTSNVQTVAAHIADYQRIILSLRAEITQLKATVASQAQHGGGAPLGAPSAAVADAQRERALAAQADEAERQTARALEASIAKVCAERRKLAQQLDSVHGALINQAAAAQAQTAADGTAAPPAADPALAATAAAIVGRLGQSEHVARQLLHAIDERISDADRAAALRTLFHAHFLDLARAHAAYELAVRQSYEDSVAAARDLPPRVQRAVGRLLEWRELRASTQPHRDFDQRMARLELPPLAPAPPATYRHDGAQLGGAGGGGADAGDSNSSSHVASDEALLALPIAAQQPSAPSRGHSSGSVAAALNVLHSHPPGQRLTPGESPRARRARPSNASGRESPVQGAGARVAMPPASGASRLPVLSPGGGARHVAQHPDGPHQAQQQPRRALVQRGGSRRASLGASQPAYPTVSPQALRRLPGGGSRALSREASPRAPRRSMFAVDAADGGSPTRSEVNSAPYYVPAAPALAPSVTGAYASGSGGGGGISAARALNNPRALVLPPQQPQTAAIAYTGAPLRAHPLANWPNDPTHDELSVRARARARARARCPRQGGLRAGRRGSRARSPRLPALAAVRAHRVSSSRARAHEHGPHRARACARATRDARRATRDVRRAGRGHTSRYRLARGF